jgi:hypothetical protein
MKAVVYNGPRDVSVKNVPDARIEQSNDVIVKIARIDKAFPLGPRPARLPML